MTDVSRSVSISKKFSSVNDSSTKHIYDGVFSSAQPSRPKFNGFALPSRIEDYAEIFACSLSSASAFASQGSSIPILDLPAVDRSRDGISSVDYSGVFGDGEVGSIGLSYEEFLRESKKRAGRDFPLPRVPPQTSAPHSRSQEFLVNSGGHRSSTVRWKQSSRSQEFPLKLWKNQTPTNNGHNLTSNVPGTVSSKSPESPPNMINSQTPISTENGHTSTSSGIRSSNSQESQLSAVNNQMATGTDNDQTSTSPAAWSLKSQEVPRSTVINPMPTSTDNVQASTSPVVQPFKSQEFPRSTGNNQMPTSTDISSVPSESQEFPLNAENYNKETSATSGHSFDDTAKHFNVSYHKINHSNTDDMTHVAELNAVSGYTCLFNEPPSKKTSFETMSSSDADMTMDDDKKKKPGKHTRATSDLSTHYPTCERASGLRRGFSGPLSSAQDSHSFGSSGSFKRLASQKSKGASNKLRAGFEGDFMPPLLVKELDVNSEAAISAAAVKRAIEEAEVQIRLAKELLKGNDDKASVKVSFKDTLRVSDTCLKDSNGAYELWRKKKVKSRSENRHVNKVNGSPRSSVEHKVPKDRKVGNAADRLTEKMQEDNVRSDDAIEKAVSSESSISPATAEEVSWYTEQREPVDQAEDMEVADGKFIRPEPNPAQESTRLDSAGGEWDAAKHLSQLFSGVKNRLVSFMSKQPETGRKVQQMDFPSASRNLDQSIESTSYIMKDVDAFKAKSDIEQLSEMEVQMTLPVPTSQKAMEREGDLHQEGAGIKMLEVEASKLKCAFVMEQEKVTEGVKRSPDCKKLNDEPRDHFEPELEVKKNFEVLGLGVDEQQEKFNCPDAAMPNELPELESEVETSPVEGYQMNEDDPEHQNVASKVRDIDIQGEAQDSSLHKYVDSATLEHEKGQMDTVRPEEHDKRPETAGSLGGLDDGEVTSWDSSDESVQEIEADEVSEERADDSFHSIDGRSGLEAAVDIKERKLENREIDVEDYKACRVEDGKYDEQCREESEIAAVSDEACKQGEREISAVNDEEHKADERENVSDLQHKGGVEILEENAPSGLLTRDDEDACLGEENEKFEAEESPSEDVASPSKVFHDSSNYNEHLAALEGVSKLANFSFFSRMKNSSDRVDQSREEACDSKVSCGEPEAMIELYTSNVEAAGGADQISSAQVVGEFIEQEMRTASVLPEGSIYMLKTDQEIKDDSATHPVNFQASSCEIEQNSEQKVDNGKAKRLSTDDSFENLGCEVEEESECSTCVVAADVDDNQGDEPMCKEEGEYNVVEDEPVADIGVTEAGVDNNGDDVPMGEEEWKNEVVGVLETGTGVSGDDVDKNQHDVGVGKEEGKHNLEASPHKRRRWFQNREQAESSKQPSILVEEEMVAEIDQEQKHAEESRLHDCVEAHVDDSGDKTGESGAVLVEKGKNNTVEVTHRRRRWFDNSQETGIPQKPILFDGNGTSKEPAPVIADESKTKEHIQSDVSNADSERKEAMREGDVLSAEGETKADMKAAHRRKRWFEHEEKIGLGQRATILEVDNEATVEMKDETETRENAANSKQSSETSTSPDISGKVDPEDIRPQRDLKETSNRNREREKERIAVERVIREARERAFVDARERAERAAAEKANTGARPKSAVHGRHGGSTSAEAVNKSIYEKASAEAKLRAERAAVERATAEARERALQKAMSEKAANKDLKYQNSSPPASSRSSASEKSNGTINESPQRRKARLERNKRTMERAAKALEEKNMRDVVAQREQAERNKFADALDLEVKRWSNGKEGNLRALLSTLQYVLGSESGWQPTSLTELVSTTAVRKAYKRAALCVHPDKLQQRGATIQQKYICEKVFDLLKEAWHKFNPDDR